MEAFGLGAFMVAACVFATLLEHPDSPVRQRLESGFFRRALMGLAMGFTAAGLIYSPWGKQSGAHLNPAVTLTFLRLGRVDPTDAFFYVLFQFLGGALGVGLSAAVLRRKLAHPAVDHVVTVPGAHGPGVAFAAELAISFLLMSVVLFISGPYTGLLASTLVALYIMIEAPYSGMSMNPARTTGSALVAKRWTAAWIYFVAPILGMLLASEVYRASAAGPRSGGPAGAYCAKLNHDDAYRCIFCRSPEHHQP
jgi:aquaporin Z